MANCAFHKGLTSLIFLMLALTAPVKVCEQLISKGQQASVKDWVLLSLGSFTQRYYLFGIIITMVVLMRV